MAIIQALHQYLRLEAVTWHCVVNKGLGRKSSWPNWM